MKASKTHFSASPRKVSAMDEATASAIIAQDFRELANFGISMDADDIAEMMRGTAKDFAMDALVSPLLGGSALAPVQFLQAWLPGFVRIATQPRVIDNLIGVQVAGDWADAEVIQGVLEYTGKAQPYGDYTNIPLSSWNANFERRSIVRFEEGMRIGKLEEARAGKVNINDAAEKREAAMIALDIQRNAVGFYGFNGGANRTYGFLNDPSLPAYVTVAATGTGATTTWSTKDYLAITGDLRAAMQALRTQSAGLIDPMKAQLTLALPTNVVDYLSVTSTFGNSVWDWLKENYPNTRVESAPELNAANGGANVFYLYAESVNDNSTDGGKTFKQIVPAKFRLVGTETQAKAYIEDYSNALGGIFVARPFAVIRRSGI